MDPRGALNEYDLGLPVPLAPLEERRRLVPPAVWACLHRIKADVASLLGSRLRDVRLFGSYARGQFDEASDVDVLILAERLEPGERERVLDLVLQHAGGGVYPMPIIMGEAQLTTLREQQRILALDLDREGIPV